MIENENDNVKQILIPKPIPPDAQNWHDYSLKLQQEAPERIEDAAKFIATMISITLSIFFASLKNFQQSFANLNWLIFSLVCWLIALFCAFFVILPTKYKFVSKSADDIKRMQRSIVNTKKNVLMFTMLLYTVPFIILLIAYLTHQ